MLADEPGEMSFDDLLTLLRSTGAVGRVRRDGPDRARLVLATTSGDDEVDRLVVLRDADLVVGPVLDDVVGETAVRCGAHLCVTGVPGDDDHVQGSARRVLAHRTDRPTDRPAALEVASLLGTDVVLVPTDGWVLVVPADDDVEPFTP